MSKGTACSEWKLLHGNTHMRVQPLGFKIAVARRRFAAYEGHSESNFHKLLYIEHGATGQTTATRTHACCMFIDGSSISGGGMKQTQSTEEDSSPKVIRAPATMAGRCTPTMWSPMDALRYPIGMGMQD